MLEYGLIIGVVLFYFYTVTCAFLAVRIAEVKGRRRGWGWLAVFFGLIGVLVICFLPNAKGVEGESNPVKLAFRKITAVSSAAVWIVVIGLVVVVGGAMLATRLTTYFQDRAHEKELTAESGNQQILSPAQVPDGVSAVFAGNGKNFIINEKGALYGWGALDLTALDESGKLYDNVAKVQSVGDTCFLLTKDGVLYARGDNQKGLIPNQTAAWLDGFVQIEPDVKDFSVSATAGALVKNTGNLYVFGANTYGQLGLAAEKVADTNSRLAENVKKAVVTARSMYYLTNDGNVYATGNNAYGQFGLGNTDTQSVPVLIGGGCIDIAAGDDFSMLLKADGTVWTAGNNICGQLGRIPLEESGYEPPKEGEESNDELPPPSNKAFGQVPIPVGVTAIDAGGSTALALLGTELYGWGDNRMDQLGSEKPLYQKEPMILHKEAVLFDTSGSCTVIFTQSGKLLGAGDRRNYQLGAAHGKSEFTAIAAVAEVQA